MAKLNKKPAPDGLVLYRFEEYTKPGTCYVDEWDNVHSLKNYSDHLWLRRLVVLRETEKGYWVNMSGCRYHTDKTMEIENFIGQKDRVPVMFILKGVGKRFAYLNIEDAANSYRIRKDRHLAHLERQIRRVKTGLDLLEKGEEYWDLT